MTEKNIYDLSEGYRWDGTDEGIMMGIWVLNKNIEKLIKVLKDKQ